MSKKKQVKKKSRPVNNGLTEKQRKFINEYIISLNATDAAIKAGYSKKTARGIGCENLTKPNIKIEIEKRLQAIEDKKIASAEEVMQMITAMARGEIEEEVVVTEGRGDGISQARIMKKQANARDRLKAMELIAKRYALFTERVEISDNREKSILDDLSSQVGTNSALEVDDLE